MYRLKIYYNTTLHSHIKQLSQDKLLYKSLQFSIAQFCGIVHGLAIEGQQLLIDKLLFSNSRAAKPIPSVLQENLRNNLTNKQPRWNFLRDYYTRMPIDREKQLFQQVGQDTAIRDQFIKQGTSLGINKQEVEQYIDYVVIF